MARQVQRLLKPGGRYALLEISVPKRGLLRFPYLVYLRYVIPVMGRLLLGNPDNYRLLYEYTVRFADCRALVPLFERAGLTCRLRSFWLGTATALVGEKVHV